MTTVAEAFVTLRPDLSKFQGAATSQLGTIVKVLAGTLGAIGVGKAIQGVITAAAEEEQGMIRLRRAVELVSGKATPELIAGFEKQIAVMERTTGFSDGQMRDSLSLLVALTGDAKEGFDRLSFAQDLAVGADIDLVTASRLLGKLTDENVGVLKRYGIVVKAGAKEEDVLAAVHKKFGGQAAAFGKTAAGSWAIFRNQVNNLKEDIGFALLPLFTRFVTAAIGGVDALRKKFQELQPTFQKVIGVVQGLWDSVPVQTFVRTVFSELQKLPGFIALVAGSLGEMFEVLTGSKPEAGGELNKLIGQDKGAAVMHVIGEVREAFKKVFDLMVPIVQRVIDKVGELKEKFEDLPPVLQKFAAGLAIGQVTGFNDEAVKVAGSIASITSATIAGVSKIASHGGLGAVFTAGAKGLGGFAVAAATPLIVMAAIALAVWAIVEVVKTVTLIVQNWDKVLILLGRAFEGPKKGILDLWHGIENFFAPFRKLLDLFSADAPTAIGLLLGSIVRLAVDGWNAFLGFVGNVWQAIFELPGKIGSVFADIVVAIVLSISSWWLTAGPAVFEFLGQVKDGFFPLIGNLKTLAGDAIGGFIKGIFDGIPGAIQAALDFAGKVFRGFQKGFDSGSPSRKMMGLGDDLMDGLRLGIDRGIGLPQGALDGLDLSLPSVRRGGAAGGAAAAAPLAGSPITINIGPMTLQYTGPSDPATVKQMGSDTLDFITQNLSTQLSRLGTG